MPGLLSLLAGHGPEILKGLGASALGGLVGGGISAAASSLRCEELPEDGEETEECESEPE